MDYQLVGDTALAVSSIVLTVTLGAWGLVLAYRARYTARITYVHGTFAPLFEEEVSDLSKIQLRISFQGHSIPPRAAVLRGAFQNRGHKDVTAAMVDRPLTIRLVSGHWLYVGSISASPRLHPHVTIQYDSNAAEVSFGPLFRRGEWLAFSALLEMAPDMPAEFPLSFEHRIADLRPIDRAKAPAQWPLRILILWCLILPLFVALVDPRLSPRIAPRIHAWIAAVVHSPLIISIDRFTTVHEQGLHYLLYFYCAANTGLALFALYRAFRSRHDQLSLPPESRPDPGLPREFRGTGRTIRLVP